MPRTLRDPDADVSWSEELGTCMVWLGGGVLLVLIALVVWFGVDMRSASKSTGVEAGAYFAAGMGILLKAVGIVAGGALVLLCLGLVLRARGQDGDAG